MASRLFTSDELDIIEKARIGKNRIAIDQIANCDCGKAGCKKYSVALSFSIESVHNGSIHHNYGFEYKQCSDYISFGPEVGTYSMTISSQLVSFPNFTDRTDCIIEMAENSFRQLDFMYLDKKFKRLRSNSFSTLDWQYELVNMHPSWQWYKISDVYILGYDQHYIVCIWGYKRNIIVKCNAGAEDGFKKLLEAVEDGITDSYKSADYQNHCEDLYDSGLLK